ncbi:hypothetical protein KCU93_g3665, partial [Aureobasidium melanogenum]
MMQFMRPIKTSSRKRRRDDEFDGEASTMTNAVPMNDAQEIPDLWQMPFVVSKDTWTVTRCLEIHGNTANRWTPAHFVAIAMWYGGIEAGIQAAKAVRIFGVWSPRVGVTNDQLPSMEVKTGAKQILSKIWPTNEYEQKPLLDRANQMSHEKSFTNFVEAHNYLLRLCIGPDLAEFPKVTLAPILHRHFDNQVDLSSAFEAVVGSATDDHTPKTYTRTLGSGPVKRNKAHDRYDNEDDEEDSGPGPIGSAAVKIEPDSPDTNNADPVSQQSYIQDQERSNASRSRVEGENREHDINATRYAPARSIANAHSTAGTQARDRQPSDSGRNNGTEPDSSTCEEPQAFNKQVINQLYKQTRHQTSHNISSFSESRSPLPALPNYWKEILRYRNSKGEWASGSDVYLPWPHEPSTPVRSTHPHILQRPIDENLFQNAKDDLVKFKRFCRRIISD